MKGVFDTFQFLSVSANGCSYRFTHHICKLNFLFAIKVILMDYGSTNLSLCQTLWGDFDTEF